MTQDNSGKQAYSNTRIVACHNRTFTDGTLVSRPALLIVDQDSDELLLMEPARIPITSQRAEQLARFQCLFTKWTIEGHIYRDHQKEPPIRAFYLGANDRVLELEEAEHELDDLAEDILNAGLLLTRYGYMTSQNELVPAPQMARLLVDPKFEDERLGPVSVKQEPGSASITPFPTIPR